MSRPGARARWRGWLGNAALVLGVLLAANVINYADRNVLFPLYDDLRARFHLDNDAIGLLTSLYMVAHAVATPAGGSVAPPARSGCAMWRPSA